MSKNPDAFRTISEVSEELDLPQHVLRFWETRFSQIKPMKRTGGRRYYRSDEIELIRAIKTLLYGQGYTIKGVQRLIRENGVRDLVALAQNSPSAVLALHGKEPRDGDLPHPPSGADDSEIRAQNASAHETISDPYEASPTASVQRRSSSEMDPEISAALRKLGRDLQECARALRAARMT